MSYSPKLEAFLNDNNIANLDDLMNFIQTTVKGTVLNPKYNGVEMGLNFPPEALDAFENNLKFNLENPTELVYVDTPKIYGKYVAGDIKYNEAYYIMDKQNSFLGLMSYDEIMDLNENYDAGIPVEYKLIHDDPADYRD